MGLRGWPKSIRIALFADRDLDLEDLGRRFGRDEKLKQATFGFVKEFFEGIRKAEPRVLKSRLIVVIWYDGKEAKAAGL